MRRYAAWRGRKTALAILRILRLANKPFEGESRDEDDERTAGLCMARNCCDGGLRICPRDTEARGRPARPVGHGHIRCWPARRDFQEARPDARTPLYAGGGG